MREYCFTLLLNKSDFSNIDLVLRISIQENNIIVTLLSSINSKNTGKYKGKFDLLEPITKNRLNIISLIFPFRIGKRENAVSDETVELLKKSRTF